MHASMEAGVDISADRLARLKNAGRQNNWRVKNQRGTLPSKSVPKRKSLFLLARPSTAPRTCWRPFRRRCISRSRTRPTASSKQLRDVSRALANAHRLFVESRWKGAELLSLAKEELAAYCQSGETRARIDGPNLLLEPEHGSRRSRLPCMRWRLMRPSMGALSVPEGHVQIQLVAPGRQAARPPAGPETGGPARQVANAGQASATRVMDSMIRGQLKAPSIALRLARGRTLRAKLSLIPT